MAPETPGCREGPIMQGCKNHGGNSRLDELLENFNNMPAEPRDDNEAIDQAFTEMEAIYRSRCVHPPSGNNVTVREIPEVK
jgi:hypothetical protein